MQQTQIESNAKYQRLLNQAIVDGVAIKARVTDKATGALLGFVVSGKSGAEYHVEVKGAALVCDCKAGKNGTYCKHRAFCTHAEIERRAVTTAAEPRKLDEMMTDDDWNRAAAPVSQGNQAVHTLR